MFFLIILRGIHVFSERFTEIKKGENKSLKKYIIINLKAVVYQ